MFISYRPRLRKPCSTLRVFSSSRSLYLEFLKRPNQIKQALPSHKPTKDWHMSPGRRTIISNYQWNNVGEICKQWAPAAGKPDGSESDARFDSNKPRQWRLLFRVIPDKRNEGNASGTEQTRGYFGLMDDNPQFSAELDSISPARCANSFGGNFGFVLSICSWRDRVKIAIQSFNWSNCVNERLLVTQ